MRTLRSLSPRLEFPASWLRPSDMSTPEGRATERHRRALFSSLAAAAAKIVSVGAALVWVPLTLHYLGSERYGMWMTMSSFIGMLSFADLGMGNGLLNAVAQANGRDDREAIRGLVSSAYAGLTLIALGIGVVAAAVYPFVPWPKLFNVQAALTTQEAGPAAAVFLACFALNIPLCVVQRVQTGLQQGFHFGLWQCGASILSLAALLGAIRMEASLPGLVLALLAPPIAINSANAAVFFGVTARDLLPAFCYVTSRDVRRIARSGTMFFVLQIVIAVAYNSDNLVMTQVLGSWRKSQNSRCRPKCSGCSIPCQIWRFLPVARLWRSDRAWRPRLGKANIFSFIDCCCRRGCCRIVNVGNRRTMAARIMGWESNQSAISA